MSKKMRLGLSIIFALLIILLSCFSITTYPVYASNIQVAGGYTTALEDLSTDNTFNAENYPVVENDYSLQVIQIAESNENDIFVYVYQPSANYANLKASSINISCALHKKSNIKNYNLALLNCSGVFYKYKVLGLTKSNNTTRYYEIISIFRPWNSNYDKTASGGNVITEVSFEVGKQFTLIDKDGETYINVADTETITVVNKYVGFMRYKNSTAPSWIDSDSVDSHFVAFSTDKEIDRLFEADVYFTKQNVHRYGYNTWKSDFVGVDFTTPTENYVYLDYTQSSEIKEDDFNGLVWDNIEYSFERIQSVSDFISSEDRNYMFSNGIFDTTVQSKITDSGLNDLKGMQWVLRFAETDYEYDNSTKVVNTNNPLDSLGWENYSIIGEVSILRLKFETDGIVYDLGVIDNKQTGDGIPDNEMTITMELNDMFKIMLILMLIVILIAILGPFLPTIISIILWIIKTIFKIVIWIISLPFKIFSKRD